MKTLTLFSKFLSAGALVALGHLGLVFVLTDIFGFWYLFSTIASYTIAIVVNFTLQHYFVFKTEANPDKRRFLLFSLLSLVHLTLNTFLMYVLVSMLSFNYLLAQALILVALSCTTFLVNRHLIFK